MKSSGQFRWVIAVLLAAACALSYLHRMSLPVAVSEIEQSIPISDKQYGALQSLFLIAYALMYAVGGKLLDWLGTRVGYIVIIVWWSSATVLQGLVSSVAGFGVARFLLGMGEGGGYPGCAKAVSEWFPTKERSMAFGIFNTGASVGAVAAAPIMAGIIGVSSWRWAFVITGSAGLLWAVLWWWLYYLPSQSRYVTDEEKQYILEGQIEAGDKGQTQNNAIPWLQLFQYRQIWGLLTIKFLTDAAWYFFIFWLPKYLADVRDLDIKGIGSMAWIPFAFAGFGSLVGGWISSFLIRKGFSVDSSRKLALAISAFLMPFSLLITQSPLSLAIVLFGVAYLGHQFWSTIVQTLAADMFPSSVVGSVAGLMGCLGAIGGAAFQYGAGYVIDAIGYAPAFVAAGVLHPLSFVLVLVVIRKVERVI